LGLCRFGRVFRFLAASSAFSRRSCREVGRWAHTHTYEEVVDLSSSYEEVVDLSSCRETLQRAATHCNTLQHTATHCNTLQHAATHCNTLQRIALRDRISRSFLCVWESVCADLRGCFVWKWLVGCMSRWDGGRGESELESLQHTATRCNVLQRPAAYAGRGGSE